MGNLDDVIPREAITERVYSIFMSDRLELKVVIASCKEWYIVELLKGGNAGWAKFELASGGEVIINSNMVLYCKYRETRIKTPIKLPELTAYKITLLDNKSFIIGFAEELISEQLRIWQSGKGMINGFSVDGDPIQCKVEHVKDIGYLGYLKYTGKDC